MRILIAYGSSMGGTEGLAEMLGDELRLFGHEVDVASGRDVRSLAGYEAVVVGGALYAMRWHKDARRFVKKHEAALHAKPVFMFSSGPLDDSARESDIPPIPYVQKWMDRIEARRHVTFGGRIDAEHAVGFVAKAMAKNTSGDWRDRDHVKEFAAEIQKVLVPTEPVG